MLKVLELTEVHYPSTMNGKVKFRRTCFVFDGLVKFHTSDYSKYTHIVQGKEVSSVAESPEAIKEMLK